MPRRANSPDVRSLCLPPSLPEPDKTLVSQYPHEGGWMTSIARTWPEGQTFCRLCPVERCSLTERMCLVVVPEFVATIDAPTYSLNAFFGSPALASGAGDAGHGLRVYRPGGGARIASGGGDKPSQN